MGFACAPCHDGVVQKKVALTGGIASGKSTVADLLAERGAVIIDSDVLAREVVEPGTAGLALIEERFGRDVLRLDGSLDRARLGAIVFADADARADLNAIVHPRVRRLATERRLIASASDPDAVVIDVIPLLVETGQADRFDTVIVVDAPEVAQLERLMARNGLSETDAAARLAAQATRAQRLAAATHVVDNTGGLTELAASVDDLWGQLTRE